MAAATGVFFFPTQEKPMNDAIKIFHSLTLTGAKQVRDAALAEAGRLGVAVSVVVMDREGRLLLAETQDAAAPGAVEASVMKARGAARYRVATHRTAEFVKTLPPGLAPHALSLPEMCAFQGGVPITSAGEVVGAIGVSGGTGEQDVSIAQAGAAALSR